MLKKMKKLDELMEDVGDEALKKLCREHTEQIELFRCMFGINRVEELSKGVIFYDNTQVIALCIGEQTFGADGNNLYGLFNPDLVIKVVWFMRQFVSGENEGVNLFVLENQPLGVVISITDSYLKGQRVSNDFSVFIAPINRVVE